MPFAVFHSPHVAVVVMTGGRTWLEQPLSFHLFDATLLSSTRPEMNIQQASRESVAHENMWL